MARKILVLTANDRNQTDFVVTIVGKNGVTTHTYEHNWTEAVTKVDLANKSPFCLKAHAYNKLTGERYP